MIVQGVLSLVKLLLSGLFAIIPDIPAFDTGSLDGFFDIIQTANAFIDFKAVGICLGVILVIYNINFIWSLVMWVIRKIPGIS